MQIALVLAIILTANTLDQKDVGILLDKVQVIPYSTTHMLLVVDLARLIGMGTHSIASKRIRCMSPNRSVKRMQVQLLLIQEVGVLHQKVVTKVVGFFIITTMIQLLMTVRQVVDASKSLTPKVA